MKMTTSTGETFATEQHDDVWGYRYTAGRFSRFYFCDVPHHVTSESEAAALLALEVAKHEAAFRLRDIVDEALAAGRGDLAEVLN